MVSILPTFHTNSEDVDPAEAGVGDVIDIQLIRMLDDFQHCSTAIYNSKLTSITYDMPVPKTIMDQLRHLIPPLNGTLHKGQSGT